MRRAKASRAAAPSPPTLAQLKLSRELTMVKTDIAAAAADSTAALTRLKLAARVNQIRHKIATGRSN